MVVVFLHITLLCLAPLLNFAWASNPALSFTLFWILVFVIYIFNALAAFARLKPIPVQPDDEGRRSQLMYASVFFPWFAYPAVIIYVAGILLADAPRIFGPLSAICFIALYPVSFVVIAMIFRFRIVFTIGHRKILWTTSTLLAILLAIVSLTPIMDHPVLLLLVIPFFVIGWFSVDAFFFLPLTAGFCFGLAEVFIVSISPAFAIALDPSHLLSNTIVAGCVVLMTTLLLRAMYRILSQGN